MSLMDYALKYVSQGLPVIPLCWPDYNGNCACGRGHEGKSIGKVPLLEHGLTDAARSVAQAKEYWAHWPKANIGIAIPPGYFVLDVDIHHNGFDSLATMMRCKGIDLLPTWLVTTGSGGQHYWYKTDKPIRNTARLAGYEGLDIRGQGGFCVASPSIHRNGLPYETSPVWDGPIVMAPAKLIELCLKPIDSKGLSPIDNNRKYLEGQRNDRLSRDAGAMRRRGLSEEAIYAALKVVNQEQCRPPLSEKEVRVIATSISRYEPAPIDKPRFRGGI